MNVLMPQLGETVAEGTITKWYKAVGDSVAAGELLFDIETDKTAMEVPSMAAGVLREIRAQSGQTVAVGAVVAVLAQSGAASAAETAPRAPEKTPAPAATAEVSPARPPPTGTAGQQSPSAASPPVSPGTGRAIDPYHGLRTPEKNFGKAMLPNGARITPLARRLAAQTGIDLATLHGSGPRGRIVAADVRQARPAGGAVNASAPLASPEASFDQIKSLYTGTPYRELPVDGLRKTIARRLSEAKQQIPHFYLSSDLDVEALLRLRKEINETGANRVSVNDMLVKAYALALREVPEANVVWAGDRLLQLAHADIGVAVAIPGGLITPIVRQADTQSLSNLASELAGLIARARERKLQPSEYTGGSASVSNLGMYGVRSFQAIVNPPQATILAVGAAERRPVEAPDGTLRATTMLSVSLSVDHRAVDGATAGKLLAALRTLVEHPLRILL